MAAEPIRATFLQTLNLRRIKRLRPSTPALLLVLVVLMGLTLRLTGVNWDDNTRLHPDERFMTDILTRIGNPDNLLDEARNRCPDPESAFEYFNTDCSIWNPDNINAGTYAYGTLPLYMVYEAAQITARINPGGLDKPQLWTRYDYAYLVGRVIDAFADTLVIVLIFLIGLRLFSAWHGLIAAALYAFAPLPIQLSHYWTIDPISNLFFVLGLYATVDIVRKRRFWAYALFGAAAGCAIASRINLVPMMALLPVAVAARLQAENRLLKWRTWIIPEGILVLGGFAVALFVFRLGQPYAFVGPTITNWSIDAQWWREVQEVSDLSRLPSDGWPPAVQWFGRIHYLYPWYEMAMWGMGLVAGITATLALIAALLRQLFRLRLSPELAVLSLWVVGYFAVTGNLHQMTMRYYLPMYSALFLLASWLLMSIAGRLKFPARRMIAPALVVGATVIAGVSFTSSVYGQSMTRVQASAWIDDTLPTTVDFLDDGGNRAPMTIQRTSSSLPLQTAFNGESYISDPFDLQDGQPVQLEIQFADTRATQVQIQFMDMSTDNPQVLTTFDRQTDAEGRVGIAANELPPITSGSYAWHVAAQWTDDTSTDGASAAPVRYFIPIMVTGSEGNLSRAPVQFRSPYQSVPYVYLGPDQSVNLISKQPITVTVLTIAHTVGDPSPLTLSIGDQQYTAQPVNSGRVNLNWNDALGIRQEYLLDHPMEVKPDTLITMHADAPLLFTATGIAIEGDWDDTIPTHFCTYSQTQILGIGLARDCVNHDSLADFNFDTLQLNMAETDSSVKYRRMIDVLGKADYLVISSNRFYDAQPRVLRRFAMSSEYYDRLFADKLNYTLLDTFRRGSDFFGIEFPHEVLPTDNLPRWMNELEAEEAFTVYDHPTVFVFQNAGFRLLCSRLTRRRPPTRSRRSRASTCRRCRRRPTSSRRSRRATTRSCSRCCRGWSASCCSAGSASR